MKENNFVKYIEAIYFLKYIPTHPEADRYLLRFA